ncbi:hypothetical protein IFM89_005188 [Coptis chinensis]|uniref:Uncharacterized protein n=1 Tax=Coptis chinensis TaxID=261450 RepID=A0A835I2T0_9MAGN|nr:hypothetical protein IFM89_005188 [Coptis chinensis]
MGLRLEEKEYFSGSLIETKTNKGEGKDFSVRNALPRIMLDSCSRRSWKILRCGTCKPSIQAGENEPVDSHVLSASPRSIKASLCKHPRNEATKSPSFGFMMNKDPFISRLIIFSAAFLSWIM